jgi:hypothetical protein
MARTSLVVLLACVACGAVCRLHAQAALPDIRQLMLDVQAHQHQLDTLRENYTFTAYESVEDLDGNGHVVKTDTSEKEDFFVNGHLIERTVKKNGKPLAGHDLDKETERVTKLVEKAEKTPRDQPLEGQTVSVTRMLEIMDVRNERCVDYHGRPTIVFDFVGRKSAKTHGIIEDASKKLQGTIWIDEAGKQVAHLDVSFVDNFHVAGGLFANIQKGSNFRFEQALVNGELWLPTAAEATVQARVLLVKNMRQHFVEHDSDYKRFRVETQSKDAKTAAK